MELISVTSAAYNASGNIDFVVVADLGAGEETIPFTYLPGDPHGLAPAIAQWLADNPEAPIDPAPDDPEPAQAAPYIYAVAQLGIEPGDISGIGINSRFSAALYLDVGSYLVFFTEEQPDTSYLAKAYDDAAKVRVTEKTTSYIAITVVDGNGDPVDPDEISVEIIRVN